MDLETLIEYYKDSLGRMDLMPINRLSNGSSNNQLLYTGELAILLKLAGMERFGGGLLLRKAVETCQLTNFPGLYTRHPEPYRFKTSYGNKPDFVPVSFDEILGACFTNWCVGNITANEQILTHSLLTNNRFCDIPKYELMDSYSSMFSKGLWADLKAYYKEAKTYETLEAGLRKSVRNHPRFYPMFFKHNSTCSVIYLAGANRDASFMASFVLLLSCLVASFKRDNISTKVLWWFRFRFLELTGKQSFLTKLAKQYYNYTNRNRLGEAWEEELFKAYYPEGHPFHELRAKI
jgi:hypothetical protein